MRAVATPTSEAGSASFSEYRSASVSVSDALTQPATSPAAAHREVDERAGEPDRGVVAPQRRSLDQAPYPTITATAEPSDLATDHGLLETLLAIPRCGTNHEDGTAGRLLAQFGGLGRLLNADADRLSEIPGIDTSTIVLFNALRAVVFRLAEDQLPQVGLQHCGEALLHYLRVTMAYQRIEHFRVLFFDDSGNLLADEVQRYGTIDQTPVYPREVVRRAIVLDAASVIIAHNHPSNEPKPSTVDITLTIALRDALEGVGVTLFDHIVICRSGHSSFRALGLIGERCGAAA